MAHLRTCSRAYRHSQEWTPQRVRRPEASDWGGSTGCPWPAPTSRNQPGRQQRPPKQSRVSSLTPSNESKRKAHNTAYSHQHGRHINGHKNLFPGDAYKRARSRSPSKNRQHQRAKTNHSCLAPREPSKGSGRHKGPSVIQHALDPISNPKPNPGELRGEVLAGRADPAATDCTTPVVLCV